MRCVNCSSSPRWADRPSNRQNCFDTNSLSRGLAPRKRGFPTPSTSNKSEYIALEAHQHHIPLPNPQRLLSSFDVHTHCMLFPFCIFPLSLTPAPSSVPEPRTFLIIIYYSIDLI